MWGIFHGFEDPVVESLELFVGITDHKFLLEVFEEVLFGFITTLPPTVTLEVVDSAAPIRGGSDAAWKPARLDTSLEIMVPSSSPPAKIRVDTTGRKYAGRESEGKK